MRYIKFKFVVKTNDGIEVTEAYYLGDLMEWVDVLYECNANEILHRLQYTGLKDKNDTEIYESDIVKHDTISEPLCIEYIQDKCKFEAVMKMREKKSLDVMYNLTTDMANNRLEVIGNIYEIKDK